MSGIPQGGNQPMTMSQWPIHHQLEYQPQRAPEGDEYISTAFHFLEVNLTRTIMHGSPRLYILRSSPPIGGWSDQSVAQGVDDGAHPVLDAELADERGDVGLDGRLAQSQPGGDLLVG